MTRPPHHPNPSFSATTTMPRTSSRLKSKSNPNGLTQPPDPNATETPKSTGTEHGRKKRKVSSPATSREHKTAADTSVHSGPAASRMPKVWRGVKGKRGLLKKLVEMPCDILLEIFGHLSVSDLHALATSSKGLRAMLLNRPVSYALWKDVGHA